MSEIELEPICSAFTRLVVSESDEYTLLQETREMLTQEYALFMTENKRGKSLSRIRAGAAAAGEVSRLCAELQEKMSGDKYIKLQTFTRDYRDFPGVDVMKDTIIKLSVLLETPPPESDEVQNYMKRVMWLETFCHTTGMLVGQMDVILSFFKGRDPKAVLQKTKDILANASLHTIETLNLSYIENQKAESTAVEDENDSVPSLIGYVYCTIL